MGLNELSSREAVLSAVKEFRLLTRDKFLKRYKFGKARDYFLLFEDEKFDSKAILGAAHKYQFGKPLKYNDFSGGERTVAAKLEELGFVVSRPAINQPIAVLDEEKEHRHPNWNRDELIVTMSEYVRWKGNPPGKSSAEISLLSKFLNRLHIHYGTTPGKTLRNPNGVYMKLMNFRRFDPVFSSQGKSGLARGGMLDEEVWKDFITDTNRLHSTASAIRATLETLTDATLVAPELDLQVELSSFAVEAEEGRVLSKLHFYRERSPKLAKAKKDAVLKVSGLLRCEVCSFDFHKSYGERGTGFIECHHIRPLESLPGRVKTTFEDLALVCANCHRMLHARRPWLNLEELRTLLLTNLPG